MRRRRRSTTRVVTATELSPALRRALFHQALGDAGLPVPTHEHRFAPPRRWRFDYAWPDRMLALEVEGGVHTGGRHVRGQGYVNDMEKYSTGAAMGWLLIRVQPSELCSPRTMDWIRRALERTNAA
jgi:hypothetical protein